MAEYPVLGDQCRYGSIGILDEQRIMTDTQTDDDVQFCLVVVEQLRLKDRVADSFMRPLPDFQRIVYTDVALVYGTDLAQHRPGLKSVNLQDLRKDAGFFGQTDAGRQTDVFHAQAVGKRDDLFNTGQFPVIDSFNLC